MTPCTDSISSHLCMAVLSYCPLSMLLGSCLHSRHTHHMYMMSFMSSSEMIVMEKNVSIEVVMLLAVHIKRKY